jgi:hypothetical protein
MRCELELVDRVVALQRSEDILCDEALELAIEHPRYVFRDEGSGRVCSAQRTKSGHILRVVGAGLPACG